MYPIRRFVRGPGAAPAAVVVAALIFGATLAPAAGADDKFTEIDVTINIYNNAGITKADARKAVAEASKILKKAKIKLNTSDARTKDGQTKGDDGPGGGTANDGKFNKEERKEIRKEGGKEVDGGKKGIKVVFGQQPESEDTANPGISVHRNPTVIVKKRASTAKTAETIAHEILHALTLSEQHEIDDTTQSNDHGHAPNKPGKSGNGNVMAPSNRRTGTAITDPQAKKVKDDGVSDSWGSNKKKATQATPGHKEKQQKGGAQDDRKDQASLPAHADLSRAVLDSTFDGPDLRGLIELDGLFPGAGNVDARYSVLFETDAGHAGADREIELRVQGDASISPLAISGAVIDLVGGGTTALPDVSILEAINGLDVDAPAVPELNQLAFEVDKTLLGIGGSLDTIPIEIVALDLVSVAPVDLMQFDLQLDWWLTQPDLDLTQGVVAAGGDVFFDIAGLTPLDTFEFFLDEDPLFTATLDASGAFSGSVAMPLALPEEGFYFLTAIDGGGNAAFNVIGVVPEPGTLALALLGVLGAGRARPYRLGRGSCALGGRRARG